jgi:O-antigen/teichoic acid export membrane protein
MEEMDIATVKEKSIKGIKALTSRTFIQQFIAAGGTFLLSVFLTPAIFGVYYVVSAIINFLTYFSDIGLAAALIQKKDEITRADLKTTFTIQQMLVGSAVIFALIFSQIIANFYKLNSDGLWLLRALIISFLLSSLKTIPSILLERKLDFQILIIPQIVEQFTFYIIAVIMAWRGMGVASFTWAVLARSVFGLITIYILRPWQPEFGIDRNIAKKLLKFGVPYQTNSFLALLKDDLLTVFLGKVLPFNQIGYIGWAKRYAEIPLRLLLDSVTRVTFPAFSRIQHSKEALSNAIEKTIFGLSVCVFPVYLAMTYLITPMVNFIPKYSKWEPAIPAFMLFCFSSVVASLSTPLTNILIAIGKIKITLYLMIFWIILTWVGTVSLINTIGFNGVPLTAVIVSFSIIVVIKLVNKVINFKFWAMVKSPLLALIPMAICYLIFKPNLPFNMIQVAVVATAGVILYLVSLFKLESQKITDLYHSFIK